MAWIEKGIIRVLNLLIRRHILLWPLLYPSKNYTAIPTQTFAHQPGTYCQHSSLLIKHLLRASGEHCACFFSTGCSEGPKECQAGLQQTGPVQDAFRMGGPVSQNLRSCLWVCVYCQSQYLIFLFCSTGLCSKTPQELWIKALGSLPFTGRMVINSPKRISSNCWQILGS